MQDLYTKTVVDRLEWLHVELQQNTVFSTTDHLSYVLKNVFLLMGVRVQQASFVICGYRTR